MYFYAIFSRQCLTIYGIKGIKERNLNKTLNKESHRRFELTSQHNENIVLEHANSYGLS